MKKIIVLAVLFTVLKTSADAQAPGIKFQKCIGGTDLDFLSEWSSDSDSSWGYRGGKITEHLVNSKGNFIVAGTVTSTNGDVTENHGDEDVFIGEMDSTGNWLWKKQYGGSNDDHLISIQQDSGNTYIVSATTFSKDSFFIRNHGWEDAWVFKIDSIGNIIWQKMFGGSGLEAGCYLKPLKKGGYLFVGSSNSIDGDLAGSGIHGTADPYSNPFDIWVMRLDKDGNKIWSRCYGGGSEDFGRTFVETSDGNFIIAGDVASADGDAIGNHAGGIMDVWIAKIDGQGNIIWKKCYGGGLRDFVKAMALNGNQVYIAGESYSWDGDVQGQHTEADGWFTYSDAWLFKIDTTGNLLFSKCYGGSHYDAFYDLKILPDGSCYAAGHSTSNDDDLKYNYGSTDIWITKISKTGRLVWQKNFGGSENDLGATIDTLPNKGLIFLGETSSNNGNVYGNHGNKDLWLVRLDKVNNVTGKIFYDYNLNGVRDNTEPLFTKGTINTFKSSDTLKYTTTNGKYLINVDTGKYTTYIQPYLPYYNIIPQQHVSQFSDYYNTDTIDFALQPIAGITDASVSLFPLWHAVPGLIDSYKLICANNGTDTISNASIKLVIDHKVAIDSIVPAYDSLARDTLIFKVENLKPTETLTFIIYCKVKIPPIVNLGDTLRNIAFFSTNDSDVNPSDDTTLLVQKVIGSYDPNDKYENHSGSISKEKAINGEYLLYTIHFQNTGTYPASNIIIRDTLSNKLDWSTIQLITSSADCELTMANGVCSFYLNDIMLSDSNTNEPASHGYIVYQVKTKKSIVAGDIINNSAGIYFDYNAPVQTQINTTTVEDITLPLQLLSFTAQRNDKTNLLKWSTSNEINTDRFEIERSNDSRNFTAIGTVRAISNGKTKNDYAFTDALPLKGMNYYRLKMIDKDGKFVYSLVRSINNANGFDVRLYPNPVRDVITLEGLQGTSNISIISSQGSVVSKTIATNSTYRLNIKELPAGTYYVRIEAGKNVTTLKFVKE